jgi:hypothetical protein
MNSTIGGEFFDDKPLYDEKPAQYDNEKLHFVAIA